MVVFVVGGAGFPQFEDDADPFVGQGANGSVVSKSGGGLSAKDELSGYGGPIRSASVAASDAHERSRRVNIAHQLPDDLASERGPRTTIAHHIISLPSPIEKVMHRCMTFSTDARRAKPGGHRAATAGQQQTHHQDRQSPTIVGVQTG